MLTGIRSSIPQMNRYPEIPGYKALFHSIRDIALIIDKTVKPGYGYLRQGTIMAVTGSGSLVPYVPLSGDVVLGAESSLGAIPIVQNSTAGHIFVPIADSYGIEVGDDLYLDNSDDDGPIKAASVSKIDRTTSPLYADITTTTFAHGNFTVAKNSYVYVGSYGSDPYTKAAYILDKDIDTGEGANAKGALTSVVVSNCVLYKSSLINLTAAAIVDLGGIIDGRFFILK